MTYVPCSFDSIPLYGSGKRSNEVSKTSKQKSRPCAQSSKLPAQQLEHRSASAMECEPGVLAAAGRSTAIAQSNPAQAPKLDTLLGRGDDLTGDAGLSAHLSELESRVEALQHSAEVLSPATISPV